MNLRSTVSLRVDVTYFNNSFRYLLDACTHSFGQVPLRCFLFLPPWTIQLLLLLITHERMDHFDVAPDMPPSSFRHRVLINYLDGIHWTNHFKKAGDCWKQCYFYMFSELYTRNPFLLDNFK